jgi:Protein of unknown function (DUF3326)
MLPPLARPPFIPTLIIPTGIGAHIGGFGGDAMTVLRALSSISDAVITHPNVANAACFQDCPDNVLYVEGVALDNLFRNAWQLVPCHRQRIGVIWDAAMEEGMRILHENTLAAVATTYGCDILAPIVTTEPIVCEMTRAESGRSAGRITNLHILFEACDKALAEGATALALCTTLPELDSEHNHAYGQGQGVDPISGLEAMLSHAVVARYGIPCANAPVFSWADAEPVRDRPLDPRTCAEFITPTFLPCVLQGLQRAPHYQPVSTVPSSKHTIGLADISALLVPASALGGLPVLSAAANNIPIFAIQNNHTVMSVPAEELSLAPDRVTLCENYLEAIAHCVALKAGLRFPPHLKTSHSIETSQQLSCQNALFSLP